jgi:hypothetical protein
VRGTRQPDVRCVVIEMSQTGNSGEELEGAVFKIWHSVRSSLCDFADPGDGRLLVFCGE